jgi:hypothetical protein
MAADRQERSWDRDRDQAVATRQSNWGPSTTMSSDTCYPTFLYLFEQVELEKLFGLLREWMLAQIVVQTRISISPSATAKPCEAQLPSPMLPRAP